MNGKGRGVRAPSPAGTGGISDRAVRAMRDMRADGVPIAAIARAWGVGKGTVQRLTAGVQSSLRRTPGVGSPDWRDHVSNVCGRRRTGGTHGNA